jgi:hypothetical protein
MLENNKIRNKTETTGFLDIIINIPENIDITAIISVIGREYPLYKSGMTYIENINFFFFSLIYKQFNKYVLEIKIQIIIVYFYTFFGFEPK